MGYKVIATEQAKKDYRNIVGYLLYKLYNVQAATHFADEYTMTVKELTNVAESLTYCKNPRLAALGYRRINFKEMNYFFLYRVEGDIVYIDDIFHGSQDYENKLG